MDFPLKVDLSSKHYHRIMDFTCPLLVGGTLVVGILIVRPEIRASFFSISEFGYRSKLAILGAACLILGYVFVAAIEFLMFSALRLTNRLAKDWITGRKLVSNPPWLSKDWQLLARDIIGNKLLPDQFWADEQAAIREAKQRAEQIGDQNKKNAEMKNVEKLEMDSKRNARQWRTWYLVLKDYFDLPDQSTRESFYAYHTVHAIGWIGFLLMLLSHHFNWLLVIWCAAQVALGTQGLIFVSRCRGSFGPDNQLVPLTSAILHHIRKDPSDKLTMSH